ncbi:MAG: class I SAM-dependent methyltransferase [Myxococcota bacterium]|nr:class I SAM-dependent methyltransferase [Myxococcota bacterium]
MIESNAWSSIWKRHLDGYLSKPPRTGFFMDAHFGQGASSFLELGCGSGRDALYLAQQGHHVVGTDLDVETLNELQHRFASESVAFVPADAARLHFPDDAFDVVFHNGLWVLFPDDELILTCMREQARVAKKYAVILVHNALNPTLVRQFQRKAKEDEIYDIRFFTPDEVTELVKASGIAYRRIFTLKFGGRFDQLYTAKRVKRWLPNLVWPVRRAAVPRLYQVEPWSKIERIACVVEL